MKKIVIIGAGAMGSAFAVPCADNNNDLIIGLRNILANNEFRKYISDNSFKKYNEKINVDKTLKQNIDLIKSILWKKKFG